MAGRTDLEQLVFQMSADIRRLESANKRALSDVRKSTTAAQREYDQLAADMGRSFGNASGAAFVAFGAITAYSIKAASDAAETANAFQVAFGNMTPQAQKFAESYSKNVGRALDETQASMAKTQLILTGIGISGDKALGITQAIQQRAVDIGSLFNVKDAEAYQAIISGISGEAEPLKRFGVALNEAAVKAELLKLGFQGNAEQAPEAAKAIARLNLIIAGTAKADGDAIKTKDGLANKTKAAQAAFRDAAVELGQNFLPIATQAATAVTALLVEFNKMPDSVKLAGLAFLGLVAAAGPITALVSGLSNVIKFASAARAAILALPGAGVAGAGLGATGAAGAGAGLLTVAGGATAGAGAVLVGGGVVLASEAANQKRLQRVLADIRKASDADLAGSLKYLQGLPQGRINSADRQGRLIGEITARQNAAAASVPTDALKAFGLSSDMLKGVPGSTVRTPSAGSGKATVDLTTGVATVDESTVVDLVNNLGGARNALQNGGLNDFNSNPTDFTPAGSVSNGLDQARAETEAFWADTIEGGLWAAVEGGGKGVAQYFARELQRELIQSLSASLASLLAGTGKSAGGGGLGALLGGLVDPATYGGKRSPNTNYLTGAASFAGFFAGGGTIPTGQWGVVNDGGIEAIRARPGGGIDVMNNSALRRLEAPVAQRSVVSIQQTVNFDNRGTLIAEKAFAAQQAYARQVSQQAATQAVIAARKTAPADVARFQAERG